jgi:hypothetical protein
MGAEARRAGPARVRTSALGVDDPPRTMGAVDQADFASELPVEAGLGELLELPESLLVLLGAEPADELVAEVDLSLFPLRLSLR